MVEMIPRWYYIAWEDGLKREDQKKSRNLCNNNVNSYNFVRKQDIIT